MKAYMKITARNLLATCAAAVALQAMTPASLLADDTKGKAPEGQAEKQNSKDVLVLKNGKTLEGKIVSETDKAIVFASSIGGIAFQTEYAKSDIVEVRRGVKIEGPGSDAAQPATAPAASTSSDEKKTETVAEDPNQTKVYWVKLEGEFGGDISQKPIREALKDAKTQGAKVIVFELKADYDPRYGKEFSDLQNGEWDQFFRAEPITKVFTDEVPIMFPSERPKIVFWVKDAMAGAAMLPMVCPNIYFSSEGRIGGMGGLSLMLQGRGDFVVQEKQYSLRLGHAEGVAIAGGYDPRLVRAMCRNEYVLSVRYRDGKPELFEGMPNGPDEQLLTDSGEGAALDGIEARVAGTGNDVLTFTADIAKKLDVSKGTVDSQDELLSALGLARSAVVLEKEPKRIMEGWSNNLDRSKRRLLKCIEEYLEIQQDRRQGADYNTRTKARGKSRALLEEMKGLLDRWGEGITGQWLGQNRIPDAPTINIILEQIKIEQMQDRK
jgi:hypothetical protein